jgi:hypothetical protein
MVKILTRAVVIVVMLCMVVSMSNAEEGVPELSVKADLELFYEQSDDVAGDEDDDKFKSNQLYIEVLGKFDNDLEAKVKMDFADVVSSDNKLVTEKVVEEANFTAKHVSGSPFTLVFGKDEMPFGLDYDKGLNDSITHQFEIDKVWGFHGIVDIDGVGSIAAATYQHRHTDDDEIEASNETSDNFTGRLTVDKLVKNLAVKVSGASEKYTDIEEIDEDTGVASMSEKDDELRWGVGAIYKVKGIGNVNAEYVAFESLKGIPDYDPDLITLGVEYEVADKTAVWGRYEVIGDDTSDDVETDFWTVGIKHSLAKNFTLMVEYSNFNSANLKDAKDLKVADGSTEDAIIFGVRAKF